MTGAKLLDQLRSAGMTVSREGDRLIVAPRQRLTDGLRDAIRTSKQELLAQLTSEAELPSGTDELPPLSLTQASARREVLAQLEADPNIKRALVNRYRDDGTMVVTLAIRGIGMTGELLIPAARLNPNSLDDYGALLKCLELAS